MIQNLFGVYVILIFNIIIAIVTNERDINVAWLISFFNNTFPF